MAESTALQETQSVGIHDVLFEKGLQSIVGRLQNVQVFGCERIFFGQSKRMDWSNTTSVLILNVLEAKIFQYNSLEGHNV